MAHSVQQPTTASNKIVLLYIKFTYVIFKIQFLPHTEHTASEFKGVVT
jgi:hypothetical protein